MVHKTELSTTIEELRLRVSQLEEDMKKQEETSQALSSKARTRQKDLEKECDLLRTELENIKQEYKKHGGIIEQNIIKRKEVCRNHDEQVSSLLDLANKDRLWLEEQAATRKKAWEMRYMDHAEMLRRSSAGWKNITLKLDVVTSDETRTSM